jgi:ribosomal protein L16/L10AE
LTIIKIFEQHSLERIKKAAERMQNGMQKGMKLKNVWD